MVEWTPNTSGLLRIICGAQNLKSLLAKKLPKMLNRLHVKIGINPVIQIFAYFLTTFLGTIPKYRFVGLHKIM
jgi:hypothetical protein